MRLTIADLDAALTEIENGPASDATLTTVRWLAIAYAKVAAWAESGALDAVINSRDLPLDLREVVKGCRDEVRRALSGDADDKAGG